MPGPGDRQHGALPAERLGPLERMQIRSPPLHLEATGRVRTVCRRVPIGGTDISTLVEARPKPVLKWAGGKWRLCPLFAERGLIPPKFNTYHEPFVGGAALFFYLLPTRAVLLDTNEELVNLYRQIRTDVDDLLRRLREMKNAHSEEFYYDTRAAATNTLTPLERAARTVYLNKTCFNGLYRVNSKGQFNVPFGRYANPTIVDEDNLRRAAKALSTAEIVHADFESVLDRAQAGDFVYFDPPYDPLSVTSSFTGYTKNAFGRADQKRLAATFRELDHRGVHCLLSNSDTPFVRSLFEDYEIVGFQVPRFINSHGEKRGRVGEVAVTTARWPVEGERSGRGSGLLNM